MTSLAAQQQALLNALFAWPAEDADMALLALATGVGSHPVRGVLAYRTNGHALAERALRAAYPVLAQMVGAHSFARLSRAVWHAIPPQHGDIARWGACLADFIDQNPQFKDVPYLGDVARLEWAMHQCAIAVDGMPDLATLELLTLHDPLILTLALAPGWATVCSPWPVGNMWWAHHAGGPSFEAVQVMLNDREAEELVVWRHGLKARMRPALPGEVRLLAELQSGLALGPALDLADALDFSQWLPLAVQTQLVMGVTQLP